MTEATKAEEEAILIAYGICVPLTSAGHVLCNCCGAMMKAGTDTERPFPQLENPKLRLTKFFKDSSKSLSQIPVGRNYVIIGDKYMGATIDWADA